MPTILDFYGSPSRDFRLFFIFPYFYLDEKEAVQLYKDNLSFSFALPAKCIMSSIVLVHNST